MTTLNAFQRTRIRGLVGTVRQLQGIQRETVDRRAQALAQRSLIRDKLQKAEDAIARVRGTADAGTEAGSKWIADAARHVQAVREELAIYESEINDADEILKRIGQDLSVAQPVADRLVELIAQDDPLRRLLNYTEQASFQIARPA